MALEVVDKVGRAPKEEFALQAVYREHQDLPVFSPCKAVTCLGCDVRLFKQIS